MSKDQVLFRFPALWQNWECDPWCYVLQRPNGSRYFSFSQVDPKPINRKYIEGLLKDYENAIVETKKAIGLVDETKPKKEKKGAEN